MSFKSGRRPVIPISHCFYGMMRDVNRAKVRCKWAVFIFLPMKRFRPCPTPPREQIKVCVIHGRNVLSVVPTTTSIVKNGTNAITWAVPAVAENLNTCTSQIETNQDNGNDWANDLYQLGNFVSIFCLKFLSVVSLNNKNWSLLLFSFTIDAGGC